MPDLLKQKYAIVGISCKFPSSPSTKDFWKLLVENKSGIQKPPENRFNAERLVGQKNDAGKTVTLDGGYLDNIEDFDPLAYGIGNTEAASISIQQRLALKVAHACLDDAKIPYKSRNIGILKELTLGVFAAGTLDNEVKIGLDDLSEYYMTGTQSSIISNRISFIFDLRGPSLTMDTACSSSLTAVNMAIASLERGDCEAAMVVGTNHLQSATNWVGFSHLGIISSGGLCKTFDASGDGYVRGEGAGAVLIKPLDQAIKDNDKIYSVISGSALNSCGHGPSLTYPGKEAQEKVYRDAFASCSRNPSDVCFAEFHGTGTSVGDPIECNAAGKVFKGDIKRDVLIGSVKTNIGHLEMASGIAALIKSSLQIYHKTMVKSLNFKNRNEGINWDSFPLKVCEENTPLVGCAADGAIVGTVSSFGFGGSNSVLVLESFQGDEESNDSVMAIDAAYKFPLLYPLGAMTLNATTEFQKLIVDTINANMDTMDNYDLGLALALGKRSRIYSWRSTAVTSAVHELTPDKFTKPELVLENPHLCYVFSGQGPQHARMGYGLYLRYEVFKASIDKSDKFIKQEFGFSPITDFGLFDESQQPQDSWPILKVVVSITMLQMALYDLWVSIIGRKPDSVLGHSVGEIAMLYASGAVGYQTCLRIAVGRARAMEIVDGNGGGMVALGCSSSSALELISNVMTEANVNTGLWLAADNSDDAITVAGEKDLVEKLCALASGKNIFARVLKVGSAFHTPMMEICKDKMMAAMADAFAKESSSGCPQVMVSSTVYGRLWDSDKPFDADYMWRNMRQPVCFRQAVQAVVSAYKNVVVLELAAHPVLATSASSQLDSRFVVSSMIRPKTGSSGAAIAEVEVLLNAAGKLFSLGFNPNFKLLSGENVDESSLIVDLPEYPFHEKYIWPPESRSGRAERLAPATTRLGSKIMNLSTKTMPWFSYHVIDGITLLPGAAYMSAIFERGARVLRNVSFEKMMSFSQDQAVVACCDVDFDLCRWSIKSSSELNANSDMDAGEAVFNIIHSRGDFSLFPPEMTGEKNVVDVSAVMARCHVPKYVKDMDERRKHYYQFGDIFQRTIQNVYVSDAYDELVCDLVVPKEFNEPFNPKFAVHPGMVDAVFQAVFFLAMEADANFGRYEHKWLPHKLGRIVRLDENDGRSFDFSDIRVLVKKGKLQGDLMISDLLLFSPSTGIVRMAIEECVFKLVPAIRDEFTVEESLCETFVQYGMPAVRMEVPKMVDVERNTRLYQYTDATAFNYIYLNAALINQEPAEGDTIDRIRFRQFCQTALKSFNGPYLKDFGDAEIASFNEENMVVVSERIGHLIPEILKDSSAGVASLFSDQVFTKLYDGDIWTEEFNLLIQRNFKECIMQAKSQGKRVLRVLEVGAGSGGLTAYLDPVLVEADAMGMHIDYLATDVTTGLEHELRTRIKHRDFATTKFDISNPEFARRQSCPEGSVERGIAPEEFDIIVSVCVLHVLQEMRPTAKSIYDLLRPGGYLLTIDLNRDAFQVNRSPFALAMDLFLGATQQWFGYKQTDDTRVVESDPYPCCLLSVKQWENVLTSSGFEEVQCSIESGNVPLGLYFQCRKPEIDSKPLWPYPIEGEPVPSATPDIIYYHTKGKEMVLVDQVKNLHHRSDEKLQVWVLATNDFEGAKAVGIARTLASEYLNWKVMILTFDESIKDHARTTWLERLVKLGEWHSDFHYLINADNQLCVRRIASITEEAVLAKDQDVEMRFDSVGINSAWALRTLDPKARNPFDLMARQSFELAPVGDYDVKVKSIALGLNFRCLLTQIGVLDGDQASEVSDFAGVVLEVGSKVKRVSKGDFVMGVADNLTNFVVCREQYVSKVPADFSPESAASFFVAFSTAWYSLITVARLQKGERVLITQATSSLGLAAIQIAQRRGAKIFCTAGTELKRNFLIQKMGLEKQSVSDSRNVETWTRDLRSWAEALDVMESSTRSGLVDIVVNTVSGPGLKEGYQSLRSLGRFIELGKRDVYGETALKLFNLAKNCSLHIIDLTIILSECPELAIQIMDDILEEHSKSPFVNYDEHVFPWWEVGDAFRLMKNGTHVGKIILNQLDQVSSESTKLMNAKKTLFSPHKTYILVGGCGGIGVRMARWMVEEGARHFILTSRSGRKTVESQGIDQVLELEMLETTSGVDVQIINADAANKSDMKRVLDSCALPVGGIFQMGLVLRDAAFSNLTQKSFDDVYLPKVNAMEVLFELLDPEELDFIILFSSLAGFVGNMGQASYVAASCYLDSLSKIPNVVSIEVPSVSQVGFFSRMRNVNSALEGLDTYVVSPSQLFALAGDAIRKIRMCSGAYICCTNWTAIQDDFPKTVSVYRHLLHRHQPKTTSKENLADSQSDNVQSEIAKLLNLDADEIELSSPLSALGLDSLSAVKLSKILSQKFSISVSQMQLLGDMTIQKLMDMQTVEVDAEAIADEVKATGQNTPSPKDLPQLSAGLSDAPSVPVSPPTSDSSIGNGDVEMKSNMDSGVHINEVNISAMSNGTSGIRNDLEGKQSLSRYNSSESLESKPPVMGRSSTDENSSAPRKRKQDVFEDAEIVYADRGEKFFQLVSDLKKAGVFPFHRIYSSPASGQVIKVSDGTVATGINFVVQDYLGLCSLPEVGEAAKNAITKWGVNGTGAPMFSRSVLLQELELALARQAGYNHGMVYPTGWTAVFGTINGLVGPDDVIVMDEFSHNCCQLGAKQATKSVSSFLHNDLVSCEAALRAAKRRTKGGLYLIIESLYSMHSDCPNVPGFLALAKKFGATIILDCAHDFGANGKLGLGQLETITDPTWRDTIVMVGTFSKTFGGIGGYCLASEKNYLKMEYASPTYTFSAQITPSQVSIAKKCAEIVFSPRGAELRKSLLEKSIYFRTELQKLGLVCDGTPSPIVMVGPPACSNNDEMVLDLHAALSKNGVHCNVALFPAVRIGHARLRFQLMATLPSEVMDEAVMIIKKTLLSLS